jgi:cytochrome P450
MNALTPARRQALAAGARALLRRDRLPPGDVIPLDEAERRDRSTLIRRAERLGPVFKGAMEGRLAVFVTGSRRGRRLLRDHAEALRPVTLDITPLVPGEFMRRMRGEGHRRRRSHLVAGLSDLDMREIAPCLRDIALAGLRRHADGAGDGAERPRRWSDTLSEIATDLTVRHVFGPAPGSTAHARLTEGLRRLGPNGVAWTVGPAQAEAFAALRDAVSELSDEEASRGLLGRMRGRGPIDAVMLGNLIYMAEFGRYDLRGLFRWIGHFALRRPDLTRRVAEATGPDGLASPEARRFVTEVLRLEQSERLMRDVLRDVVFEGFLIPRGALLRVCMWENHKDPETFAAPFAFDPDRFLAPRPGGEAFSPFGLDQHRCPYADVSVEFGALLLETLAREFDLAGDPGEGAIRGPYHWEPGPGLSVVLAPRDRGAP